MAQATLDQRIQNSAEARRKFWDMLTIEGIGGILMIVALFIGVAGFMAVAVEPERFTFISEFYANISSELASIVITIFVLDKLNARRDEQQRKLALFRQVKSRSNGLAIDAIDQLRYDGYWDDMLEHFKNEEDKSNLSNVLWQGANLSFANLEGANLSFANLEGIFSLQANLEGTMLGGGYLKGAVLWQANLKDTNLVGANLVGANFLKANLEGANLNFTNLESANFVIANLTDADFLNASLEGANLSGANLESTNMYNVTCNENTILPDGKKWTPNVDWSKYGAVEMDTLEWRKYKQQKSVE